MANLGSQTGLRICGTYLEIRVLSQVGARPLEDSTAFYLTALISAGSVSSISLKNKCGPQLIFTRKAYLDISEITKLHSRFLLLKILDLSYF